MNYLIGNLHEGEMGILLNKLARDGKESTANNKGSFVLEMTGLWGAKFCIFFFPFFSWGSERGVIINSSQSALQMETESGTEDIKVISFLALSELKNCLRRSSVLEEVGVVAGAATCVRGDKMD